MEPSESNPDSEGGDDDLDWSRRLEADASMGMDNARPAMSETAAMTGDDDDDDDNWSRQVETDEIQQMPSSVIGDVDDIGSRSNNNNNNAAAGTTDSIASNTPGARDYRGTVSTGLAPKRKEPTLKEKLVEREREGRFETERARLKRHFVLSSNAGAVADDDSTSGAHDGLALREYGSVAGTVGEGSTVAQIDPDENEDQGQQLTYPMERFLQEQGTVIEEEPAPARESSRDVQNQGVVMERFLKEPVVVVECQDPGASETLTSNADRSVSFDMEPHSALRDSAIYTDPPTSVGELEPDLPARGSALYLNASVDVGAAAPGNTSIDNASVDRVPSEAPRIDDLGDVSGASDLGREQVLRSDSLDRHPPLEPESPSGDRSTSSDQPRLLGLTAAEIQEMAAIEEASRSNGPPSERDDLSASSFVGELVSDLGGPTLDQAGTTLSQGTPTTAMESASIASGNQSAQPMSDNAEDQHSIDEMGPASISLHIIEVSSAGVDDSVAGNPPSDIGADETPLSPIPDEIHPVAHISPNLEHDYAQINEETIPVSPNLEHDYARTHEETNPVSLNLEHDYAQANAETNHDIPSAPHMPTEDQHALEVEAAAALKAGVVNRQIRPGMANRNQLAALKGGKGHGAPSTPIIRSTSVPDKMNFDLDGFDYDKNAPMSPGSGLSASIRDLPVNDLWSPGSKMSLSPFRPLTMSSPGDSKMVGNRNYGAVNGSPKIETREASPDLNTSTRTFCGNEVQPLLPDFPHEIIAAREESSGSNILSSGTCDPRYLRSKVDGVFSDIRSESITTANAGQKEAQEYLLDSVLKRAFPERFLVLTVTLLVEIPVLLMVSGGSDRLCWLIGRSKYQLLMGLLPLSSAISGNVGLQASTLTTRAVSHGHVTPNTYKTWLVKEIGAALFLGLGMGAFLGVIAYMMSGSNFAFGVTVMTAQFVSILTAGCTGTLAPLVFSFVFGRDAGKWGGPLVTAIQDIIGSFAMVIMSYKILEFFGPMDVDAADVCGGSDFR
jgi:cation transporter-like permease